MQALKLYTTSECHLCEQAEQFLNHLQSQGRCQWQPVEVADHDVLVELYGIRIPVIAREGLSIDGQSDELGWPFSLDQLSQWLLETVD